MPAQARPDRNWPEPSPEVLSAYLLTRPAGWPEPEAGEAGAFFRERFVPAGSGEGLLTGYCEPEFDARTAPDGRFIWPLHQPPPDLRDPWFTRREMEERNLLDGFEIAWLASPLDAFLAQVQGSVRLRLPGGREMRLGFAGRNGHPYRSIGAELVRRGALAAEAMSLDAIRSWAAGHPSELPELLRHNPSYVFFRELDIAPTLGPVGSAGVPLTADVSVAVDRDHVPLGAPLWLVSEGPDTFNALVIAQDTGSAIVGPGRVDLFLGSGAAACGRAGRLRQRCRVIVLCPRRDLA
ncbi:MAG: murein transglycosylase A [Paracoccaceae bacterium]